MTWLNEIHIGHALNILKQMPDDFVDCVVTSPPYWGLRDYGLESIVWDGDENCEHKWVEYKHPNGGGHPTESAKVGSTKADIQRVYGYKSTFCSKCSAWRGSLGLEPTHELYIKHLLEIFDEVKRVLRKDGTCWVNLGDSYSGSWGNYGSREGGQRLQKVKKFNRPGVTSEHFLPGATHCGIPPKSLVGIPEMFVLVMRDRGWIRRNTIIWHKPNCMPSSATDRFTVDFEYVFFFVKSNDTQYWINEKTFELVGKQPAGTQGVEGKDWEWRECPSCKGIGKNDKGEVCKPCKGLGEIKYSFWSGRDYWFEQQFETYTHPLDRWGGPETKATDKNKGNGFAIQERVGRERRPNTQGRNKRCVWNIPTQPFPDAHFAVFPEALVEPMIRSGCPEFICKKCGKPREKIYKPKFTAHTGQTKSAYDTKKSTAGRLALLRQAARENAKEYQRDKEFIGLTDCGCNAEFEGGIVLDPFIGSGTVAKVAIKLRRNWIGIDIKPEYKGMAEKRMKEIQVNLIR